MLPCNPPITHSFDKFSLPVHYAKNAQDRTVKNLLLSNDGH